MKFGQTGISRKFEEARGDPVLGAMAIEKEPIFLQNLIEANLLDSLLEQEDIPHYIKEYRDPSFKGSWHFVDAWGHVECPGEFRERIISILEAVREENHPL